MSMGGARQMAGCGRCHTNFAIATPTFLILLPLLATPKAHQIYTFNVFGHTILKMILRPCMSIVYAIWQWQYRYLEKCMVNNTVNTTVNPPPKSRSVNTILQMLANDASNANLLKISTYFAWVYCYKCIVWPLKLRSKHFQRTSIAKNLRPSYACKTQLCKYLCKQLSKQLCKQLCKQLSLKYPDANLALKMAGNLVVIANRS